MLRTTAWLTMVVLGSISAGLNGSMPIDLTHTSATNVVDPPDPNPPVTEELPPYWCKYECTSDGVWMIVDLRLGEGMMCSEDHGYCDTDAVGFTFYIKPSKLEPAAGDVDNANSQLFPENTGEYVYQINHNRFVLVKGRVTDGNRLLPSLTLDQFVQHYPDEAADALSDFTGSEGKSLRVKLAALASPPSSR